MTINNLSTRPTAHARTGDAPQFNNFNYNELYPSILVNPIAGDHVLSDSESRGMVSITGHVGHTAQVGDIVRVHVNNKEYNGTVRGDYSFVIDVRGSDLAEDADRTVETTIYTRINNLYYHTTSRNTYSVSSSNPYPQPEPQPPYNPYPQPEPQPPYNPQPQPPYNPPSNDIPMPVDFNQIMGSVSAHQVHDAGQSEVAYFIRALSRNYPIGYLGSPSAGGRGKWEGVGHGIHVNYSFATRAHNNEQGFKTFSNAQKAGIRNALSEYSTYANITFSEVEDGQGDFRFYLDSLRDASNSRLSPTAQNMCRCCGGMHRETPTTPTRGEDGKPLFNRQNASVLGYAYYGGDVHLNSNLYRADSAFNKTANPVQTWRGGYGTAVHEIGHSLGLKHSGNYGGSDSGPFLPTSEENSGHTTMSYKNSNQMTNGGLQIFDLAAIHYQFGVNRNQRAGNDTYRFQAFNQSVMGNNIYIWDGAGLDTFDASAERQGVYVDLTPGSWIYSGQKTETLVTNRNGSRTQGQAFIGYGTQIEQLVGSNHNDTLKGNNADNVIMGNRGDDQINGGRGNDKLAGGEGNDTYIFDGTDFGHDVVYTNGGGRDTLVLNGASYHTVMDNLGKRGNDLILRVGGSSVTVKDWFAGGSQVVQTVRLGSGETISAGQINSAFGAAHNFMNAMAAFGSERSASDSWDNNPQSANALMLAAAAI